MAGLTPWPSLGPSASATVPGANALVSLDTGDSAQGGDTPILSADGKYVAFRSSSANLASGDTNGKVAAYHTSATNSPNDVYTSLTEL